MKNSKLFFALMLGLVVSTGCSKWDQDPMKNQDKNLGDGLPVPTVPVPEKPTASDSVLIDTVDSASFTMGTPGEFKIGARVLLPDYNYQIQIANWNEFPGAKFDPATGVFTWTPDASVIPVKETRVELVLQVTAVANPVKPNTAVLFRSQNVKITVNRVLTAPELSSITINGGSTIREGGSGYVTVLIDDVNATSDKATWPTLIISGPANKGSLAPFTVVDSMDVNSNGQIQAVLKIDLADAELTKSTAEFGLVLKAVSVFNKVGAEKAVDYTVFTQLATPQTTWNKAVDVALGTKLDYQFLILDPKSEGIFNTPTFSSLPAGAQATCTSVSDSVQSCRVVWSVPATQALGTVTMYAAAELKNTEYYTDHQTVRQTFRLPINVVKTLGPVPSQGDLK